MLIASGRQRPALEVEGILARRGYTILRSGAGDAAVVVAQRARPDVIILDAELPGWEGLDVSRAMRGDPQIGPSTPILLIAVQQPTRRQHRDALRAGIWGFLTPPLDAEELTAKLDSFVLTKREADRTWAEPRRDETTGLYDVRGLAQRARELTLQAFHHHAGLACVALAPAAEARDQFAQVLKSSGRMSDAIGRLGAAEFAVVAPGTDPVGAVGLAERLARLTPVGSLRAGYDAVGNVRYTPLEPKNLLARAWSALRLAQAEARGSWIRAFEEPR